MISNILEIGRQEGAQFEKPVEIDLISFLKEQITNYTILAKMEEKEIVEEISPEQYKILTQPTLLMHILQNFVQNAVKKHLDYQLNGNLSHPFLRTFSFTYVSATDTLFNQ